jgi:hypothetical protein
LARVNIYSEKGNGSRDEKMDIILPIQEARPWRWS